MDIDKPTGDNPGAGGGLGTIVFAILLDNITGFPARGADLVTMTTDFALATGTYIHQIYATHQTIEPKETKLNGENKDCGGVEISLSFFHPGLAVAIQEFKAKHMSSDFILLIKNANTGTVYVIGEPSNPAYMEGWDATWGKGIADGKGTTFTFKSQQSLPMGIYTGAIDTLLAA
jgi:hypothetical protein